MATASTVPRNRVSVSLRLPEGIVSSVSAYAEQHAIRKTDAYLHFLELGMAHASDTSSQRTLDQIRLQTAEILRLMKRSAIMDTTAAEAVLAAIAAVAENYPAIKYAYLFGSFAHGTETADSDVDVQLVLDREKRFNLRDLSRFSKELEKATQRECDIVTADALNDKEFAEAIEAERILAYERPEQ